MDYIINFSWRGLLIFALTMIPNIFYFVNMKNETVTGNNSHKLLDLLEHGSQAVFLLFLMFLISKKKSPLSSPYILGMAIFLISYYILWVFYAYNYRNLFILSGLAVVPVIYYLLSEAWLHNYLAMIPTMIFGITHIVITYLDFKNS